MKVVVTHAEHCRIPSGPTALGASFFLGFSDDGEVPTPTELEGGPGMLEMHTRPPLFGPPSLNSAVTCARSPAAEDWSWESGPRAHSPDLSGGFSSSSGQQPRSLTFTPRLGVQALHQGCCGLLESWDGGYQDDAEAERQLQREAGKARGAGFLAEAGSRAALNFR